MRDPFESNYLALLAAILSEKSVDTCLTAFNLKEINKINKSKKTMETYIKKTDRQDIIKLINQGVNVYDFLKEEQGLRFELVEIVLSSNNIGQADFNQAMKNHREEVLSNHKRDLQGNTIFDVNLETWKDYYRKDGMTSRQIGDVYGITVTDVKEFNRRNGIRSKRLASEYVDSLPLGFYSDWSDRKLQDEYASLKYQAVAATARIDNARTEVKEKKAKQDLVDVRKKLTVARKDLIHRGLLAK